MLRWLFFSVVAFLVYQVYSFIDLQLRQRKKGASFARKYPGGPFGLVYLQSMIKLSKTFRNYEVLSQRARDFGRSYGLYVLGQYIIFTTEPENVKALLATQFADFGKGDEFTSRWRQFLGAGIFNADGQTWSHARALMRPQFLKERVSDLDNFEDKIQSVFKLIKPGQVTDVMDLWFRFTLDAATEHLFGQCADSLHATAEENKFAHAFAEVQELQTKRDRHGPTWRWPIWSKENARFQKALTVLNEYVGRYVSIALRGDVDEKDDSLLAALVRDNQDPVFLRDSMVSALLAGRDTTAATLSWLIKELSKAPQLYADLRAEVLETLGTEELPTYSQIKNMKLLQATINETLRLYPIVPFNIRAAFADTTLPRGGGADGKSPIFVPAGSAVVYSPLVLQRAQDIPDAEQWKPRRWVESPEGKYVPAPWTYIPFNGGPRICLGQNFALTEIAYALARLLQYYVRLESRDESLVGDDLGYRFDIILTPRHGVQAIFFRE